MITRSPQRLFAAGFALAAASVALFFLPDRADPAAGYVPIDDFCLVAPALPYDPASGLPMYAARAVPADARCPVCGMYPARFPRWAAQAIYSDGAAQFFDSPVNLYIFLGDVNRYNRGYVADDVVASFVTDVDDGNWIAARDAYYVHGSDALGPMRDGNLPAFATREAAQRFADARGGIVLAADDITAELLRELSHTIHHHH